MTQIPLKDAVRAHVEKRRLSDAQFEALTRLQVASPEPAHAKPPRRGWWVAGVAAAAVVLVVALAALIVPLVSSTSQATPEQIADEVVRNHIKLKPLEVASADMNDIRAFFVELDFVPVDSGVLAQAGFTLEGGRYCSIQGVEAAQLRGNVAEATEEVRSIYMVPYAQERFGELPVVERGEPPLVLHARGLAVEIWVEQDVLMAMTGGQLKSTPGNP